MKSTALNGQEMTRATLRLLGKVHAPEEGLEAGVGAEGIEDFSVLLGRSMPFYQFCGLCGTSCPTPLHVKRGPTASLATASDSEGDT